jgi:alcohol dehydrogenase (NADP+)
LRSAPDGGKLPPINAFTLFASGVKVGGSSIGTPWEIEEMLQLALDKNIKPWVEKRSMKDANQALIDLKDGKPRYRYVLCRDN